MEETKQQIKNLVIVAQELIKSIDITDDEIIYSSGIKFLKIFNDSIPDIRVQGRCKYRLHDIIIISLFARLRNYNNACEMHDYCHIRADFLRKIGVLGEEIPSHDTFRRIFTLIDSKALLEASIFALKEFYKNIEKYLPCEGSYYLLSLDGKEICGSGRSKTTKNPKRNTNIMNFYETSTGLVIECQAVGDKTNEIPIGQQMLEKINLKQTIVTFDALNTQTKMTSIIKGRKGDYVATVKENQQCLLDDIKQKMGIDNCNVLQKNIITQSNKRFYFIPVSTRVKPLGWDGVFYYICYEKDSTNKQTGEIKTDTLYFITSLRNQEAAIEAILNRWKIENDLHRNKDLLLEEDAIRFTNPVLLNNMAIINNLALSLITLSHPLLETSTLKSCRKTITMGGEIVILKLMQIIGSTKLIKEFSKKYQK